MTIQERTQRWQPYVPRTGNSGLSSVSWDSTAFVMPGSGSDVTGTVGRLDLPFATVQAAVDAVYAVGGDVGVVLTPGDYAEDVVTPASATAVNMVLQGASPVNTRLRSLELSAPSAGGVEHLTEVLMITLGGIGPQVKSPLLLSEDAGDQFVLVFDSEVQLVTDGLDAITVAYPTATGALQLRMIHADINRSFDASTALVDAGGIEADHGRIEANFLLVQSKGRPCLDLSGDAEFATNIMFANTYGPADIAVRSSSTLDLIIIQAIISNEPTNPSDFIVVSSAASVQLQDSVSFGGGTGAGGITLGGGLLLYEAIRAFASPGLFPTLVGVGLELLVGIARSLGWDPSTTVAVATNQQALNEEIIRGRFEVRGAPVVGAGPHAVLTTDNYVGADTAATAAPMTITLPAIATVGLGREYVIGDETGAAASFPITVSPSGGDTIDTAVSDTISVDFQARTYRAVSGSNWKIIS